MGLKNPVIELWETSALRQAFAERAPLSFFGVTFVALMLLYGCGGATSRSSESAPTPIAIAVSVSPTSSSVQVGKGQTFTATVTNDSSSEGVSWALSGTGCSGATCGTLSSTTSASGAGVTYTAPASVPSPATVTITATSVADSTKSGAATITVTATPAGVAVTLSLTTATVQVSGTQGFTATVANDSANKGVTWALSGAGCSGATCGTLSATSSASGTAIMYKAPASVPTPATVILTATSVTDGTKSAAATITVTAAPLAVGVTLSLTTASVQVGSAQPFTATVANDPANEGVTWTVSGTGCSGATCGTVAPTSSASGVAVSYTAPASVPTPAAVTLTATSVADTTKSASAAITVTASNGGLVSVTLTPKRGGLAISQALNFTATVTNDVGGAGVNWTATAGTFSAQTVTTATYVAPATAGVITVTATSNAATAQSATATIGVTDLSGVTTYHNDLSRDGVNAQEYALTTANVTTSTFGKLFSCTADGAIYAQPLWVPNVSIGGGTHNVIVAATMHDSVYVFDADASPCVTYWNQQLIPSGETYGSFADVGSSDIYPDIGITGTPVIDPSSNTIYLVTKTKTTGGTYHQRLHALSLASGAESANSPVEISSSITFPGDCEGGSTVAFNTLTQNQRPGLALVDGVVYVSWASHGDQGVYHGWVVGYQTSNLANAPTVFNATPNAAESLSYCRAGIWMSGGAPAADASNNLYVITGNGVFDGASDFGDSYLKLGTPGLTVSDFFTPHNQSSLDAADQDVGSSGTALLIDQTSGPVLHLLVGGSKASVIYVINRDNMGQFNSTSDLVVQSFSVSGHSFSTPAFWSNTLYYFGVQFGGQQAGQSFAFSPSTGLFNTTPAAQTPSTFGFPGATPSISATPSATNGIVWAIDAGAYGTNNNGSLAAGPAIVHAYGASSVATELWNSSQASGGRDTPGNAVKFTVPTVANGKVYVGTRGSDDTQGNGTTFGEIDVYGLLPN